MKFNDLKRKKDRREISSQEFDDGLDELELEIAQSYAEELTES